MSYMNDPREMAIRPESGVTLEQDNRVETMYHWGAMITDLCDLPVSEYMKPMTVIVYGNGGGDYDDPDYPGTTLKTENVKIWFTVLKNGNVVTDEPETVFSVGEDAEIVWTARWEWTGSFSNKIQVAAVVQTDKGNYTVSAFLTDNEEKQYSIPIEGAQDIQMVESYKSYGVASTETPVEKVTGTTYTETVTDENTKYKFEVSSAETIVYLTLKLIGATSYTDMKMRYGNEIPFDKVSIEKEGYDFLYWVDSKGVEYTGTTMPAQNLTLTAKYEVKKCHVEFVFVIDGDEKTISSTTVNYGSKVYKFPTIDSNIYKSNGWVPSTSTVIKDDTIFKATLEYVIYTVTWSGYTDGPLVHKYKYGETLEVPEAPKKEGHTFTKWNKTLPQTVTSNLTFTAIFDPNKYVLTYWEAYGDDKVKLNELSKTYGDAITLPKVPSEKGFTYSEWQSEYTGKTMPAHNVEYVTVKTANTYILAYYDNGVLVKEEEYKYMDTINPYEYIKEGWVVSEWTNLPETMPYNNVSAHCTTEIMRFTVVFVDQDGVEVARIEGAPYGTVITDLPVAPEGYSYSFNDIINEPVKSDVVVEVEKTINYYNVTINDEIVSLPYGTNIETYVNDNYKAEEGYDILITEKSHNTVPADNSAIVKYVIVANVWLLTYSTEGADENISGSENVAFGTNIFSVLPSTEKEGYIFNGWKNGEEEITNETTMPNNDLTVMGTYDVELFEVSIFDGDIKILNKSYAYKTKLSSVLNDETIVEYVSTQSANGQTVSFVLNGEPVNGEMEITSNLDIYVEKTPNEYLLIFMNGGETISDNLVKFGDVINYPTMENKTEDGIEYVFVWNDTSYDGKTMPAHDLTIVGNYKEKAEAPIYFGSYVIPIDEYSDDNISKYYKESDLSTNYYDNIQVSKCIGNGAQIVVFMPGYPPFANMTDRTAGRESAKYYEPPVFIVPISIIDGYNIAVIDGLGVNIWDKFITDNIAITINGSDYYFYSHIPNDTLTPGKYDNSDMKFTLKLTEK